MIAQNAQEIEKGELSSIEEVFVIHHVKQLSYSGGV